MTQDGDGRTVRATVGEVAQEDKTPAFGVRAVISIAEVGEQIVKGVDLAVRVSDQVEGGQGTGGGLWQRQSC